MNKYDKPELLAPAGSLDILKIAFIYGADAVYCGTPNFGMRTRVGFTTQSLKEGIDFAHSIGKKIYITINAFPHPLEIEQVEKHILDTIKLNPDALIVADPGLIVFIRQRSSIPIHLSTQANTTNQLSAEFWRKNGVDRIVLARELSLKEIAEISKHSKVSLEAFVHGAMCMAYSGRCQISNYLTGRDPNQGDCIQACRFKYKLYALEEEQRPGEYFPIYEDEEGAHILNSKDLCMIKYIPELIEAGIKSFKIEGRLKSEYYVATTVKVYRQAIDLHFSDPIKYKKKKITFEKEVSKAANRGFTTGFYFGKPDKEINNYTSSKAIAEWGYIGRVISYDATQGSLKFQVKNQLKIGSVIEIITPTELFKTKIPKMFKNGAFIETAHADNIVEIAYDKKIEPDSLIRVKL